MSFPVIPSGMFSGQGSTTKPNVGANGSITSGIVSGKITNLSNAFDSDPTTFAEIYNSGTGGSSAAQTQEVLFTHSPATGLVASSFLYVVLNIRVIADMPPQAAQWPGVSFVLTMSGNYNDATPILSTSNPYTVISASQAQIQQNNGNNLPYNISFNGNIQIPFDQFAPKTIDIYSLSLSAKWQFAADTITSFGTGVFDARIYDISYIYL